MSKTIVMIHGMWGGGWYWENFKNFFQEKGYRCHAPTLRHHDIEPNAAPPPSELGNTSLLDYAEDLEKYILTLDEKPILMGHSMGGLLAQILGSRGLANSLVLLTSAPPSGIFALKFSVLKSFWSVMTTWGFWKNPSLIPFEAAVYATMHMLPENERKPLYDKFVYESGRAAAEIGLWLLDPQKAARVDAKMVDCPVLVIAGSEDRITPASVVKKIAEKYKTTSTYKEFKNHAHWILLEPGWEEVATFVLNWINKNG